MSSQKTGVKTELIATNLRPQPRLVCGDPRKVQPLTKRKAWSALTAHFNQVRDLHLRDLSAQDPERGERMTLEAVGLHLDYSKNRITDETLQLLFQLATQSGFERADRGYVLRRVTHR